MSVLFPPVDHMVRAMQVSIETIDGEAFVYAPVTSFVSNEHHLLSSGFIATLIDVYGAGFALKEVEPDMVATSSLAFNLEKAVDQAWLGCSGRLLRKGKRDLLFQLELFQASNEQFIDAETVGSGSIAFSRLAKRGDESLKYPSYVDGQSIQFFLPDTPLHSDFINRLNTQVINAPEGQVQIPSVPEFVINRLGALQGGAIAEIAGYAALTAADSRGDGNHFVADMDIAYLALGKVGPITTSAKLLREAGDHLLYRVRLHDQGNESRLMSDIKVLLLKH